MPIAFRNPTISWPASTAPVVSCEAGIEHAQRLAGGWVLADAVAVGVGVPACSSIAAAPSGSYGISSSAGMSRCQNADAGRMIVSPVVAVP